MAGLVLIGLVLGAAWAELGTPHWLQKDPRSVVAFGSCNKDFLPQPLWAKILDVDPLAFLWLGDVVYNDEKVAWGKFKAKDLPSMKKVYASQLSKPEYAEFTSKFKGVIDGIWDDHDYGLNDGGADFPLKNESMQLFLDFLNVPKDSERRNTERGGVYTSFTLDNGRIKVILLDNRFSKSDYNDFSDKRTILGEAQWKWLEKEIKESNDPKSGVKFRIIGGGVQFLPDNRNDFVQDISNGAFNAEGWALFPKERTKLFSLLGSDEQSPPTVFLSGDIHFADLNVLPCHDKARFPMVELTSSGLTHTWDTQFSAEFAEHLIPQYPLLGRIASAAVLSLPGWVIPARFQKSLFMKLNFGAVFIDWEKEQVSLQIRDKFGIRVIDKIFSFSSLRPSQSYIDSCSAQAKAFAYPPTAEETISSYRFRLGSILGGLVLLIILSIYCVVSWLKACFCSAPKKSKKGSKQN